MKNIQGYAVRAVVGGLLLLLGQRAGAGVPFNNLEGAGGAAFNPLAYPAGQNADAKDPAPLADVVSKPQFGAWYVSLSDVNVDWTAIGTAFTVAERLELSYGYEVIAPPAKNIRKDDVGAKLLLVREGAGGQGWVPAVSVGTIWKNTSGVAADLDGQGLDYYAVASKLIAQSLGVPVLLSGGVRNTHGRVTGVFGYDHDGDTTLFGNVDVIPLPKLALGVEYEQGADFGKFKNADYWDAHAAFLASANLTLIGAYVNAGDSGSSSKVGLGDGLVLSAQYAF